MAVQEHGRRFVSFSQTIGRGLLMHATRRLIRALPTALSVVVIFVHACFQCELRATENLLVNGSFESPDVTGFQSFVSIPGWTATQNGLPWGPLLTIVDNGFDAGLIDANTLWGNQFQETFNATHQDFATIPGAQYSLDFEFATFYSSTPEHHTVSIYDQTSSAQIASWTFQAGPAGQWYHFANSFTAFSNETRLRFERTSASGANTPAIDNVIVLLVSIPEPSSMGLLIFGSIILSRKRACKRRRT